MARTKRQIRSYRITRGPRKGQTIQVRMGANGKWTEVKKGGGGVSGNQAVGRNRTPARLVGSGTNKSGVRKGKTFLDMKDVTGRKVHRYSIGGKVVDVVLKPKKKARDAQVTQTKQIGKGTVLGPPPKKKSSKKSRKKK